MVADQVGREALNSAISVIDIKANTNPKQSFNGLNRHEFKDVVRPLQYHCERELDQRARDVEAFVDLGGRS